MKSLDLASENLWRRSLDLLSLTYIAACVALAVTGAWFGVDALLGWSTDYWTIASGAWAGSAVSFVATRWALR